MVTLAQFRKMAMALPEVKELPHFDKTSFRVKSKIFATFNIKENRACLKFNSIDQDVFSRMFKGIVYPVPNKFGSHGWTLVQTTQLKKDVLQDILTVAYCHVAPPKLSESLMRDEY